MKLLLDTHALLWWLGDDPRLGASAREKIAHRENTILASVASLWEIAVKIRVGKLVADIDRIERAVVAEGFERLAIERPHLAELVSLPRHHRDPFDHLLIAQARHEGAALMSEDATMAAYPVEIARCSG